MHPHPMGALLAIIAYNVHGACEQILGKRVSLRTISLDTRDHSLIIPPRSQQLYYMHNWHAVTCNAASIWPIKLPISYKS